MVDEEVRDVLTKCPMGMLDVEFEVTMQPTILQDCHDKWAAMAASAKEKYIRQANGEHNALTHATLHSAARCDSLQLRRVGIARCTGRPQPFQLLIWTPSHSTHWHKLAQTLSTPDKRRTTVLSASMQPAPAALVYHPPVAAAHH
jgi:hypothetical protein